MSKPLSGKKKRVNFEFEVGQKVAYMTDDVKPKLIMEGKVTEILKYSFSIEWNSNFGFPYKVHGWTLEHLALNVKLIENGLQRAIKKAKES